MGYRHRWLVGEMVKRCSLGGEERGRGSGSILTTGAFMRTDVSEKVYGLD
jgi:hypothetical protein